MPDFPVWHHVPMATDTAEQSWPANSRHWLESRGSPGDGDGDGANGSSADASLFPPLS